MDLDAGPMTAGPKSLSVLIVDDHEVVRVGLRTVLSRVPGIDVVGEAETGAVAVAECQRLQPDLVLLEIRLPDRSGVDVCRDLLTLCPSTRVVFLTICADDENVVAALLARAHGYVLKEGSNQPLIEAIKTVGAGQSLLAPQVTGRALSLIRSRYSPASSARFARLSALSAQEERTLRLIADGKTNKEIAQSLALSDKTVKNYIAKIYDKLQVSSRSQATRSISSPNDDPPSPVDAVASVLVPMRDLTPNRLDIGRHTVNSKCPYCGRLSASTYLPSRVGPSRPGFSSPSASYDAPAEQ